MNTKLEISGFKCFIKDTFELNNITLLTGSNGTGKSSLIQALLLVRLAIEKNLRHHKDADFLLSEQWNDLLIPLNNGYQLQLGTVFDIIREDGNEISICLNDEIYTFTVPEDENDNTSVKVNITKVDLNNNIPFWRKKEFYYLHTERLGPRHSLPVNFTDFVHCGFQGEYTAQVLVNISKKVGFSSAMINSTTDKLDKLTNDWLAFICPGVTISASPINSMTSQIKVRGNSNKSEMLATNIGFGISYALPIIVSGLIAQKDSILIVENPEAHLHPKGQSNIGYFLGKVADSCVKVILETHSEHVVNGVRRATLSSENLKPSDANIYFFNGFDDKSKIIAELIGIEYEGSLNKFPRDFFDQVNQDMREIINLSKNFQVNG
jgi:predicted ATPase